MTIKILGLVFSLGLAVEVSPAMAFHADIFLTQQSGKLLTGRGAADPGSGGVPQVGVRFHVNDIAGLAPFVDTNPGFSAEEAGDSFFTGGEFQPLPLNRNVGFNVQAFRIQNGAAANLFYWNGSGDVSFQPVTNLNDRLEVRVSALGSAIATGAAEDVAGFDFTATDSTGFIHSHLVFDFDVDNNSATAASTGVFMAALEFNMDMDLVGDSTREVARPHYVAWFNGPPGTLKTNAMAGANLFLADNFAELRLFGDISPLGEDNLPDDLVDATDIDTLLAAIQSGSSDSLFDMNDDTVVNASDATTLFDILDTQYGDANLDGSVDGLDLAIWQMNYGTASGWAAGNFNGDAEVNGRDFLIWQRNYGFTANLMANVHGSPEPTSASLVAGLLCLLGISRKGAKALNSILSWRLRAFARDHFVSVSFFLWSANDECRANRINHDVDCDCWESGDCPTQ